MSQNPDNTEERSARVFEPEPAPEAPEAPPRRARQFIPDAEAQLNAVPPPITATEPRDGAPDFSQLKLERIPVRGLRALGLGLLALVLVIAGAELVQLFSAARETHWLVAAALGTLIGGVGLLAVRSLASFLGARKSLDQLIGLRHLADRMSGRRTTARRKTLLQTIQKFYRAKPQAAVLDKALETLPDYSDDAETLQHLDQHFVMQLDRTAMQIVSRYSAQTGAAVAISPWAAMDMLLALWRSISMIDAIAQVYGVAPSYPTRLKLLRQVLQQLTFVGASEVTIDQLSEDLGGAALAGVVSARAGQGLGAGILSARLGLAAMRALRPLPFGEGRQPGIRALLRPLIDRLKQRFSGTTRAPKTRQNDEPA
ncbi:YcjF family protein [Marinobacterium rhizophilum]|uniref:YcjF family protein n=1 Tax=Marinobacterium rhizophilum TaxID=420402 RepID=UPI00039BF81C|nr:YcjF family protein [Marinobacterium rhizophilum]